MSEGNSGSPNNGAGCYTSNNNGAPGPCICNGNISASSNHFQDTHASHKMSTCQHLFDRQCESCGRQNYMNKALSAETPLMHITGVPEAHKKNITTWIRNVVPVGNAKSQSSDSFVINFDNVNEPSSSVSENYTNRARSEDGSVYCTTTAEFPRSNNSQPSDEESISNRTTHFHVNNNNNSNSNSNSNMSINNIAIPMAQTGEGTQDSSNSPSASQVQTLDKLIHSYFPLITFLLVKALYDHREGIFIFIGLLVTFVHANSVVKREIAKKSHRSLLSLGILFINLFVCICFIYFVFHEQKLYKSLVFIPPYFQPLNIWDLLWMVGITDFVLKFITIQLKAGVACFPAKLLPYSSRGKWFLMLECSSQLYRGLAPIQPWLYYLNEAYQGPEKVIGVIFSLAYSVSKGTELCAKIKLFIKSFFKLIQNVSLGVRPTKEELDTFGSQCPICHDEYNAPVQLHCRHVFCEGCVATWFDKEQTCPLCRAKITDDPSWRDGATTFFAQLF